MYKQLNEEMGNSRMRRDIISYSDEDFNESAMKGIKSASNDNNGKVFNVYLLTSIFQNINDCMNTEKVLKFLNDYNNDPDPKVREKIQGSINNKDWDY